MSPELAFVLTLALRMAFAAAFVVTSPTDGVMNSLPLYIYSTVRSGEPAAITRAFAAATVLLALVLVLFVISSLLARPRSNRPSIVRRLRAAVPAREPK